MKFEEEELTVHNLKRRIMGSLMAVLMSSSTILGTCPAPIFATASNDATVETEVTLDATAVDANQYGLVSVTEGNILHAWDWKFTDVTKGIEEIVEAGYSVVQVSPCQTCEDAKTNNDWWKLYQPYDYSFGNSLGSEEDFKEMCDTAEKYGVSIVVDVVANHVAGTGTGNCGERKSQVNAWWTDEKFHGTGVKFTGDFDENREMMVRSNIGMPDIATEREDVQERMISYLETMLDMGADGFRYDAAKHIGTTSDSGNSKDTFWKNISAAVAAKRPDALVYGEILNGMPVSDEYYVNDGIKVTESQKGWDMKDLLQGTGTVSQKTAFNYTRKASADKLITWVENHDTYLNHWGSTGLSGHANYMSDEQIILAWSTVGARADSQALFFARPDGCSNPDNPNDNDASNKIDGGLGRSTKNNIWKDKRVAAVNKFKNAMVGEKESCSTSGNVAIIQRGNKGVVATNFGGSDATVEVSGLSGLKDGTYQDAANGGSITVSGGKASVSVKAKSFVVLYDADAKPVETEVPATTEPTETPVPGEASVSVSKEDCTFEDSFKVTVTAENCQKAYVSYDGAEWKEFEKTTSVTIGEEKLTAGDQVGLFIAVFDKDGKLIKKEYTYTKEETTTTEGTTSKFEVRVSKDEFTSAPNCYVYQEEPKSEYNGEWPGKAMTESGNYYVFSSDSITSAKIILNDASGWRSTADMQPGLDVTGAMEYSKASSKLTPVQASVTVTVPPTGTKKATKPESYPTLEVEETATPAPATEAPAPATEAPTPVVEVTEEPPIVEETPSISVDVADGSEFDTETMKVVVTAKNATNATYTIDGGVTTSFSGSTEVILGEGKIADSEVTLKVTVTDGKENIEKTYTYKKVFNPGKAAESQEVKISAIVKIQNAMEIVKDAAEVNALSGEPSSSYYATNPNKQVGSKKTIKSAADFSESDIIAQGVANDNISIFKGSHEGPVYDTYALFGAYDDQNVYIGVQYVNVIDVVDPAQGYPQSDNGKPYAGDIPQMMVFDTGSGDYTDGTANDAKQKTAWDTNVKFAGSAQVDKVFLYAAKPQTKNTAFFPVTSGIVDYTKVQSSKEGTDSGITYTYEDGFFCSKMYGINGNGYAGYTPEELNSDSSNWVDFLTTSHSTSQDSFMIMTVPMSTLGVTADKIEKDGIGIMSISTYGASGIGSCPQDLSMLDIACEPYSKDESTSAEKEDEDTVTVSLAQLGGVASNVTKTPRPIVSDPTPTPGGDEDEATATPVETVNPDVTATPVVTEEPGVTTPEPEVTEVPEAPEATPVVTEAPENTPVVTETPAEPVKVEISETDKMVVNFGANLSAPQMSGTDLTLEAKPLNTNGTCQYQFAIDGVLAQGYSEESTYAWKANAGVHTIQVSVKDEANQTVVVEKQYTVVGEEEPTPEPTTEPTAVPTVVPTPIATANVDNSQKVPDAATSSSIAASLTVNPAKSAAVKSKVKLVPNVTGFKTSYTYSIVAKKSDGTVTQIAKNSNAASATWVPTETGTYTLTLKVVDAEKNETSYDVPSYKITKLKLSTAKASKKTIKAGSKVKFTAKATNVSGSVKYQFVVKKGSKKIATRKYNKKATYTWAAKKTLKAGTYKCVITAKDSSGVKVSKTVSVKVKAKAKAKKAKK